MFASAPRALAPIALLMQGLVSVLAGPAAATTFVPIDDGALADRAALIAEVEVLAAAPAARGPLPAVDYRLALRAVVKGSHPGSELTVRVPGGVRPDGVGLAIRGLPPLVPGARALVFLERRDDGTFALTELMLGLFLVDEEGPRPLATRALGDSPAAAAAGPLREPARDLERFLVWLRDRTAGLERAPDYLETRAIVPRKFALFISSSLPPPLGCGSDGGHGIRWFSFDEGGGGVGGPVAWRRGLGGLPGIADGGAGALFTAAGAWSAVGSIWLVDAGTTAASGGLRFDDGVNAILFEDPGDEIPGAFEGTGLLAVGGAWFRCDELEPYSDLPFHVAFEGDIVVQDGIEAFFAASADPQAAAAELFAHELGHTLGLDHSSDGEALMYALIHDDGRSAALGDDDRAAAELLYTVLDPGPSNPTPPGAPPPPTDVAATLVDDRTVELEWRHPDPEVGIRIERRVAQGAFAGVATVGGVSRWTDPALLGGTTYGYRLRAVSGHGSSAVSPTVEVTTAGSVAPAAPSDLRAAPLSPSEVRLGWQDNADNELFYRIDIRLDGAWQELAQPVLPADATEVYLGGLEAGVEYRFRVRADGVGGSSAPSNAVRVRTFPSDAGCVSSAERLCLLGGRYAVEVRWRNQHDGGSEGIGQTIPTTDKTGQLYFFNPANVELIVKMLDGGGVNGHAWVFYGGLSDVEYWVRVTDTERGAVREYHNPPGEICGRADTGAFPVAPSEPPNEEPPPPIVAPGDVAIPAVSARAVTPSTASRAAALPALPANPETPGTCEGGPETLCLLDGRFALRVHYRNQHAGGAEGVAKAIAGTDRTGYLWFFDLANTELVIKVLDGRPLNGHFWLVYGALTDLEYTITATDTVTGIERTYTNPPGEICGRADPRAFPEDPPEPPAPP